MAEEKLEKPIKGKEESPSVAIERIKDPKISCTFIFEKHSDVSKTADLALKEGDIILVEGVGLSNKDRRKIEEVINALSVNPHDSRRSLRAKVELMFYTPPGPNIFNALIDRIGGTGKKVFLIDVSEESSVFKYIEEEERVTERLLKNLIHGRIKKSYKLFKARTRIVAEGSKQREAEVLEQIKERLSQYSKDVQHKPKFVIIMGVMHTYPSHKIAEKEGVSVERIFPAQKYIFSLGCELERRLRFPSTRETVEEEHYLRAFVELATGDIAIEYAQKRGIEPTGEFYRKIWAGESVNGLREFIQDLERKPNESMGDYSARRKREILSRIERNLEGKSLD